jgi:hypothetical protein
MNHRCYNCGWNFALGRETVELAVATAGNEKTYAIPCPRCRKINKIPMQQLKRALPSGWTPPAPEPAAAADPVIATQEAAPPAEPEAVPVPEAPPVKAPRKPRAAKTATEATPSASAKKTTTTAATKIASTKTAKKSTRKSD